MLCDNSVVINIYTAKEAYICTFPHLSERDSDSTTTPLRPCAFLAVAPPPRRYGHFLAAQRTRERRCRVVVRQARQTRRKPIFEARLVEGVFAGQDDHRPRRGRGAKLSPAREADRALALRGCSHLGGHFLQLLRDARHRRSGARAFYRHSLVVAFQVEPVYSQTDETEPAHDADPEAYGFVRLATGVATVRGPFCAVRRQIGPDEAHLTNLFKRAKPIISLY